MAMPRRSTSQPREPYKTRKQLLAEIPDLVSSILTRHLDECCKHGKAIILDSVQDVLEFHEKDMRARAKCLEDKDWVLPPKLKDTMSNDDQEDYRRTDPSLLALDAIAERHCAQAKSRSKHGSKKGTNARKKMMLPRVQAPPKYDAWIPVRVNYWVGKELHVEPYMPFLGDQDQDCELAFEVFEDMADDAGKEIDLSDGEVNRAGTFDVPRDDIDRVMYYSMPQARWREASRKAILAVLDQFSKWDDSMWRVLATALGIKDIRRIKAVAKVAQERRREWETRRNRRNRQKEMERALSEIHHDPRGEDMPIDESWSASANPGNHFCFVCHVFLCPQHKNFGVEPILPIDDLAALERTTLLKSKTAKPCSKRCFLLDTKSEHSGLEEWSAEEILLLREAVPMFGLDPCSIALVVGTRSCDEVSVKLDDPIESDIAHYEIQKARKSRKLESGKKKQPGEGDGKKDNKKISSKTVVESRSKDTIDQDFSPCYHNGPCTQENCTCVKKGMHCETTCGCNCGRYTEGGRTGGIVWTAPSEESLRRGTARECQNRHYGCDCEAGHCDSAKCPCWDQNRACSPDLCGCDVTVLPNHVSVAKRRCRNVPTSIAKHKKTFMGTSDVHGFGLFAGDKFESGDLVGVYSGQLIDTRLADMIGRLYDATDRTYIFNVTESLVIDGGLLGSKAKFCNHTRPGAKENCASRLVRVRGDAYVALFCKRPVEPGEEFLFDYRFTGEVPSWAKDDNKSKWSKQ